MSVRDRCACGRLLASRVFKQHARRCTQALVRWAETVEVWRIDERSAARRPRGCTCAADLAAAGAACAAFSHEDYPCPACRAFARASALS